MAAALRVTVAVVQTGSIETRLPCGTKINGLAACASAGRASATVAAVRKVRRFIPVFALYCIDWSSAEKCPARAGCFQDAVRRNLPLRPLGAPGPFAPN